MILGVGEIGVEVQFAGRRESEISAQRSESRVVVEIDALLVVTRTRDEKRVAVAATARRQARPHDAAISEGVGLGHHPVRDDVTGLGADESRIVSWIGNTRSG